MSRRSLAFGLCFLLMCSTFIPMSLGLDVKVTKIEKLSNVGNGNILYVGGSGPDNYTKIQDAIDNASWGDTVFVYDEGSPYYENIDIQKSIKLIGEDRETTIIDGSGEIIGIYLQCGRVVISGFTIRNNTGLLPWGGIFSRGSGQTITGNNIINNSIGINIASKDGSTISNNLISNNDVGIDAAMYSYIYHNNFINNTRNFYSGCYSTWDDGLYGNYWDDYKERYPDAKESKLIPGTWNTPYEIDLRTKDRHPLINQWPSSRHRTITKYTPIYDSLPLRLLDSFPILKEVILRLIR